MGKLGQKMKKFEEWLWPGAGLLFALMICLPFLILGERAVVTYHDQLDGELITYLLNAKHLFQGLKAYPELMGGISPNGVVSPAPLYVLFYRVLPPYGAFLFSMILTRLVQFFFLYLLIRHLTDRRWVAFALGIWFVCLPFYPVYGLSIPGQPMLYYALQLLWEGGKGQEDGRGILENIIYPLILIFIYGLCSSLALCGFACLALLLGGMVYSFLCNRKKAAGRLCLGFLALLVTYLACNLSLVGQLLSLGDSNFQSHKSEIMVSAAPFWQTLWNSFLRGEDYCNAFAIYACPLVLLTELMFFTRFLRRKKLGGQKEYEGIKNGKHVLFTLGILFCIALWRALYQTQGFVNLRNGSRGVLHEFNFGRFTWLMPVLWCICISFCCDCLLTWVGGFKKKGILVCTAAVLCGFIAVPAVMGLYSGDVKPNVVKLLRGGDYYMMTWEQFYAQDLFQRVDEVIGRPKEEYHVVSLGIYPAAAIYNGFYCLDGYSNNYDVNYKHQFRRIIAPELAKSDYLRKWFDEWGNRCYLLLAQYNNYFTLEKRWGPYTDAYDLDYGSLREMGGEYLISATYLIDAQEKGLKLLNEEPIETEGSWYRLWVYVIKK